MGGRGFARGGAVLEGTVETAEEIAARAARQAGLPVQPVQAIAAPKPGTAVVPRAIDWTPGGNPPPGGALQPRTVDWTYGEGGGPRPAGMAQAATAQAPQVQAIDGPHDAMRADPRTMGRTAAGARAGGAMSPEAAAFESSRAPSSPVQVAEPAPQGRIAQAAGKVGKYLAPAAKFAAAADIASNAYNSGRDGGAIQIEPSEQQMQDYQTQGGLARFASAAKHGLTAGVMNVGDAAMGVVDSAASLPNMVLPAGAQIPSAQEHYRGLVKETFSPSGAAAAHGTATIRDEKPRGDKTPGMAQAAYSNEGRGVSDLQDSISPAAAALRAGTGNAGDATVTPSGNLQFTQPGFDPTQQQFANGTGAMTSTKTGKTMVVAPGIYLAADGSETDDWSKTQAYADAIKRNQSDKVRLAEMQAQRLGGNPQDILLKSQGMAQSAAESSLNQQGKQQALDAGQVSLEQAQQLQYLGQLMTEGKTPEVRAEAARAYHAMTGKGRDTTQEQYDNIVVKDYDQNGTVVGEHIEQRPKNRAAAAARPAMAPPPQAIEWLKNNHSPQLAAQFDAKYGEGAARKYLGK